MSWFRRNAPIRNRSPSLNARRIAIVTMMRDRLVGAPGRTARVRPSPAVLTVGCGGRTMPNLERERKTAVLGATSVYMLVFRVIHVLLAIAWGGMVFLLVFFL